MTSSWHPCQPLGHLEDVRPVQRSSPWSNYSQDSRRDGRRDFYVGQVALLTGRGLRSTTMERGSTVTWSPGRSETVAGGLAGS
jgi:hypothetical protein